MKKIRRTKLVYEGQYVAEVDVELIDMNKGWSPYLSLDDAYKLDDIHNSSFDTKFSDQTYPDMLLIQFQQNRCRLKSSHHLSYTLLFFSTLLTHPILRHFLQALHRSNPAFFPQIFPF